MPTSSEPNWIPPEVKTARIEQEARMLRSLRPVLSKPESLAAAERMIDECGRLRRALEYPEVESVLRDWLRGEDGQRRVRALTETTMEPVD